MQDGPYELLEVVGRGGMGTVHRARCRRTGQMVAVKLMTAERAAEPVLLKRFEQEFQTTCRLRHPHLVQGLDFGLYKDRPYLVMEFVEGQNLARRVQQQGWLAASEAVRFILQVADALQLAHDNLLVHRDVKPDNILLTADGQAKLIDLGLIKNLQADVGLTAARACLGTINYMAPEQFDDAKYVNIRSDIYGLGATLYYTLTGVIPFQGRIHAMVLRKKLVRDFILPSKLHPNLSPTIEEAICRALNPEPEDRYATCAEFMAALQPAAEITSPEPTATGAERRVAQRHPVTLEASCESWPDRDQMWSAEILDVSATGLRLVLDRRCLAGTILGVKMLDENLDPIASVFVRVCWDRDAGSSKWIMGCAFTRPLTDGELQGLLTCKLSTVAIQHEEKG